MLSFVRGNMAWMLVALLLSLGLWSAVAGQQNPDVSSFVSGIAVEFRDKPAGLVATSSLSPVSVDVRAPLDALPRLLPSSFRAYVDVSNAAPGVFEFPVQVEPSDRRVHIENINPQHVTVRLEAIKKKEVPVRLNVLDTPPFGYVVKSAKVSPDTVTVSGPEGAVDQVIQATVSVRVDNARTSISQSTQPIAQNSDGEPVKGTITIPDSVLVEVPVEQQLTYKALPVAPQLAGSVALGYQIIGIVVDPTIVTVVGDPSLLEKTSFVSTQPISVAGVTADVVANGELALPNGISLVRRQPLTVRVYVSPVEANKVLRVVPQLRGLGDKLRADLIPSNVDVTISGPMPILSTLRPQDVQATLDLKGIVSGAQPVTVTASVPAPLRIDEITPKLVNVTVRPQ